VSDARPAVPTIAIVPGRMEHARALAKLCDEELPWSRLRELGRPFLTVLHRHMITSRHTVCRVAERDGEVVGYIVGLVDPRGYQREFFLRYSIVAGLVALPRLLNPRRLAALLRGLRYFGEVAPDDPKEEFLSFAVSSRARGGGVGRALLDASLAALKERGVKHVRLGTVNPDNATAITFYERYGFRYLRTVPFYSDSKVAIYVYDLQ
jgi:ribosomal protein S18 acetylase RimI-like enzyme